MPTAQSINLAVHCKRTEAVDLVKPIVAYIRQTYSDREANEAADDVAEIQKLRNEISGVETGASQALKDGLVKYYRYLTSIETRFPVSRDKAHAQVAFTWCDAFNQRKKNQQYNIHFEKAAVLFNLGSVISQMGLACDRSTADGLKLAVACFQVRRRNRFTVCRRGRRRGSLFALL